MGPTTIQMHWFLGTTKIPMDSNRSTFRKRKTPCPNIDQTLVILAFNQLLKACCLRTPVASWFTPPPKKKKKPGQVDPHIPKQTKASIKLAMFGWLDKNLSYTKNVTFQHMRDSHLQALKIWKILGLPQVESLERHTEIGQYILYHPFQQKHVRQNGNSSP